MHVSQYEKGRKGCCGKVSQLDHGGAVQEQMQLLLISSLRAKLHKAVFRVWWAERKEQGAFLIDDASAHSGEALASPKCLSARHCATVVKRYQDWRLTSSATTQLRKALATINKNAVLTLMQRVLGKLHDAELNYRAVQEVVSRGGKWQGSRPPFLKLVLGSWCEGAQRSTQLSACTRLPGN
jgi:hypothetical protein